MADSQDEQTRAQVTELETELRVSKERESIASKQAHSYRVWIGIAVLLAVALVGGPITAEAGLSTSTQTILGLGFFGLWLWWMNNGPF